MGGGIAVWFLFKSRYAWGREDPDLAAEVRIRWRGADFPECRSAAQTRGRWLTVQMLSEDFSRCCCCRRCCRCCFFLRRRSAAVASVHVRR